MTVQHNTPSTLQLLQHSNANQDSSDRTFPATGLQGLILRSEGKIQQSFEMFQRCRELNPQNVDNLRQMARSLSVLPSTV